jgi:hypothetical protein
MPKKSWPGDKPTGKTRTFSITVSRTARITIDESIFAQAQCEEPYFNPKPTDIQVVEHLAFNRIVNGLELSHIDGYANCPNESVTVAVGPSEIDIHPQEGIRKK